MSRSVLRPRKWIAGARISTIGGICDTVCFFLFDRNALCLRQNRAVGQEQDEFVRRGAFALLACVALHKKDTDDSNFLECLSFLDEAAKDERNFVKKPSVGPCEPSGDGIANCMLLH